MVAPIIRNLKPKLNIKAIIVTHKRNIPRNPKILGVFPNSSKKCQNELGSKIWKLKNF